MMDLQKVMMNVYFEKILLGFQKFLTEINLILNLIFYRLFEMPLYTLHTQAEGDLYF